MCLAAGNACYADILCPDVLNCAVTCTDSTCIDICILLYGDSIAEQLFIDYYNCLGCSCANDCQVTGCP